MEHRTGLLRLATAITTADMIGATVASRFDLPGEPLRIRPPSRVPAPMVLAGWGSALSGPLLVDVALLRFASSDARPALRACGWLRLVGVLSEPVTWGRRRPRWTMAIAAVQLALAARLISA